MRVVFCFLFLKFSLSVTYVFAQTQDGSETSAASTFPITKSTASALSTTESTASTFTAIETTAITLSSTESTDDPILPIPAESHIPEILPEPCSLERPVVSSYKNTSIEREYPTTSWTVTENCEKIINLSVICTNIETNTNVSMNKIIFNVTESMNKIIFNVTEVSFVLDSLEAGATYRCEGKLERRDELGQSIESPPSKTIIISTEITGKITPEITATARSISIKWAALSNETKLVYVVEITEIKPGHFLPICGNSTNTSIIAKSENPSYKFIAAMPDYNYTIVISTTVRDTTISSDVEVITTNAAASGVPRNVLVAYPDYDDGSSNISQILSWNMPCHPNGQIQRFDIDLNGVYIPDHSHSHHVTYSYPLKPSEALNQETYYWLLEGLRASTKYTLNIWAVGVNGLAGTKLEMSFETRAAIPSAPIVYIASQSSSYLDIHWEVPNDTLYGKITGYNLDIVPLRPAYGQQQRDCPHQVPISLPIIYTNHNYTNVHPYWIYEISVNASTSQGTGPKKHLQATTNTSAPEKPRNLNSSDPDTDDGSKYVEKFLTWDGPCFPNDRIISYEVVLNGVYSVDGSPIAVERFNVYAEQERYNETLQWLSASTNYTLSITAIGGNGRGEAAITKFTTRDAIPNPPIMNESRFNISNTSASIVWNAPTDKAGEIIRYEIEVTPPQPLYSIPEDCMFNPSGQLFKIIGSYSYDFSVLPYFHYTVGVAAATNRGLGALSMATFNTSVGVPDIVRDFKYIPTNVTREDYDVSLSMTFKKPCFTNGILKNIRVHYKGIRADFVDTFDDSLIDLSVGTNLEHTFAVKPEYHYIVDITTENDEFNNTHTFNYTAPSGVPSLNAHQLIEISKVQLTGVDVTLRKEQFNYTNGDIKYISLILAEVAENGAGTFDAWSSFTWPVVFNETEYQLTDDFWSPFEDNNVVTFSIGSGPERCLKTRNYCNAPLKEDTEYYLIIRMLTQHFYKNSPAIPFRTGKSLTGFIIGILFGLLLAGMLAIAAYILWRRGYFQIIINRFPRKSHINQNVPTRIPCRQFLQYCRHLECNPQKYQEQYTLLTEKAAEIKAEKTITIATLPENKRKNRYTNIAPYDETRVELRIDEDDEIGSDYINASFIKGYSGNVEYIATQGPMVTTTRDFWKMVLQENVTLIVMVSQFVENDKQKCHRYFPKNHENMIISDDVEVRCSTELHFGTYCVRNLQVRKDDVQATVTHMQFLDWPDFGVPTGTDHVLQFCYQLRERSKLEGGLIIVHCSAGVGRTGTLIATDILLQTANAGKHIDVFNTVLELRKQRVMMVQTEKQYVFIHNMLKEHLDRPPTPDLMENSEPVYENMEIIKHSRDSENVMNKKEDESEF